MRKSSSLRLAVLFVLSLFAFGQNSEEPRKTSKRTGKTTLSTVTPSEHLLADHLIALEAKT